MRPLPATYHGYERVATLALAPTASTEVIAGGCGFSRMSVLRRRDGDVPAAWVSRAGIAARLQLPGCAALYELGRDDAGAYVLREYVVGLSLAALTAPRGGARPGLPAAVVAALARGLGRTLAELHGRGLVHGSIHARNVVLDVDGRIVLCDLVGAAGAVPDDPSADLAALAALLRPLGEPGPVEADAAAIAALVAAAGGDPRHRGRAPVRPPRPRGP